MTATSLNITCKIPILTVSLVSAYTPRVALGTGMNCTCCVAASDEQASGATGPFRVLPRGAGKSEDADVAAAGHPHHS